MLCIVLKYHLQDIKKKNKKKNQQKKKHSCDALPRHSLSAFRWSVAAWHSQTSQTIQLMSYLFVVKGERGHDLPCPDVQIWVAPQPLFPPYCSMLTWSRCLCFFFFIFFFFTGNFTDTVKVATGPPLSLRWLPLFFFFFNTVCTFSGTYTTSVTVDVSLFFTVAIIYIFGALVHGKHVWCVLYFHKEES